MAKNETQAEENKRFYEPKCPVTRPIYQWQVDEDGHHYLVKTGEKNFDDEIQLYKDQCDIKILVDKILKGDVDTIARLNAPKVYGDVNNYPQEYHPAAGSQALHQLYENQPDSVKAQFPTYELFEKYFTNLTAQAIEAMNAQNQETPAESEAVNNEQ